ncbi:sugar 3,4-ketoisomerase [Vibrio splendidus]|jgi:dTDP-4-dehydrorhamnose 3,5-epimerase-like enzyme|uniref:sugar 3,4-ketoisomerase n=1 Tax=Vibrio splendidus TaxID=29497 RepID=UPI0021B324B0|nr:FdtA/QdtA family cupin domain-containing protein [Vibrio splendidus]UWZ97314.1 WxcM-like domain-containing protein [Vibrio splendidus]
MSLIRLIEFNEIGDSRGKLVSLEGNKNIPFEIKRIYYIFNTSEDVSRGFHAHKNLQQVAICLSGKCRFTLDDGFSREEVVLDAPNVGLYIDNNKWREMDDFSEDCVLLVIASDVYDEDDYIRSYEDFLRKMR